MQIGIRNGGQGIRSRFTRQNGNNGMRGTLEEHAAGNGSDSESR